MSRIKKGWAIFKMSYKIAKEVKAVWWLIVVSLITELLASMGVVATMLFKAGWSPSLGLKGVGGILNNISDNQMIIFGVIFTFISVFIATFFNFAISQNILEYLRNKKLVTAGESIKFAFSRLSDITIWSLILLTVNILFQILNSIAEKLGAIGEIIMKIINGFLGVAWSLLTLFVVPIYVDNEGGSVLRIMKKSKDIFVSTWGETVIASASVGVFSFLFIFGIAIFMGAVIVLTGAFAYAWIFIVIFVLSIIVVSVFTSAMDRIYKILLYLYAESKMIPDVVEEKELIENGFVQKKEK